MPEASLGQLVSELIDDLGQFVRQELRLAQSEMSEKFKQAQHGLCAIVTGFLVAFCALLVLLQALVIALSKAMPPWLAAMAVAGVLAIVAFALIRQGRENLKARNLIPQRSLRAGRKVMDPEGDGKRRETL